MSVKLPSSKKAMGTLQHKLYELLDMLLQVDYTIETPAFDEETELQTIKNSTKVPKIMIRIKNILREENQDPKEAHHV